MQKSVLLLKKYAKTLFAIWLKEKPTAKHKSEVATTRVPAAPCPYLPASCFLPFAPGPGSAMPLPSCFLLFALRTRVPAAPCLYFLAFSPLH